MKCASLLYLFAIICLVVAANSGSFPVFLSWYKAIPYGDTVGHFILFGFFAFNLNLVLEFRPVNLGSKRFFLGSVVAAVFVTVEESTQLFLATRSFALSDLLANYVGIYLLGELLGSAVQSRIYSLRGLYARCFKK